MNLRRLNALMKKEFIQIMRDPSSILISVLLPLILLFIYGFGVSLDIKHLKIGLVLEDTSPLATSFMHSLSDSGYIDTKIVRDRRELDKELTEGSIRGIVIIPSYFSRFVKSQDNIGPIQVIADGSEPNTASFVQNYVQQAWSNWLQQENISNAKPSLSLVSLDPRFWYNEELESRNFLIPGSLAIIMTLTGTLLTALVVAREWERGTMESLMSTPVTIMEILIGKLIPYFILAMGSMIMSVVLSLLVYDIPFRGSWVALLLVSAVFLFPALGLGLFISTVTKSQVPAAQFSMTAGFLPAFILSGFIFEISSMPLIIQGITYIIPARYFVTSLQTLFLAGDNWQLIFKNIVPMLIIGTVVFLLTLRRTVKRLD